MSLFDLNLVSMVHSYHHPVVRRFLSLLHRFNREVGTHYELLHYNEDEDELGFELSVQIPVVDDGTQDLFFDLLNDVFPGDVHQQVRLLDEEPEFFVLGYLVYA